MYIYTCPALNAMSVWGIVNRGQYDKRGACGVD
nr:MAG TPA: Peroxidase, family 2 [Caudoviricetes sp.]